MLRKLVTLAIASTLSFGIAEVALRRWPRASPPTRPAPASTGDDLPVLRGLRDLLAPNQRGLFGDVLYETNSRGLRDREYAIPKPAGAYRIVAIGGSTVMGSKVPAEASYASRIEERLAGAPDVRFDVVDVGVAGANLEHAVARLEKHGLPYEPDLIVYGFSLTDIRFRDAYRPQPAARRARRGSSGSAVVDSAFSAWDELAQIRRAPGTYAAEVHDNYFDNPQAWGRYTSALDRLAAVAAAHDACVLVLLHTQPTSLHAFHPFLDVYERVAAAARERGMTAASSFDLHRGETPRSLWIGDRDRHANERAHEILTRALARGLTQLPDTCWKGTPPPL